MARRERYVKAGEENAPIKKGEIVESEINDNGTFRNPDRRGLMHRCHDCGKLTWDYRCAKCRSKFYSKHHVPVNEEGEPDVV